MPEQISVTANIIVKKNDGTDDSYTISRDRFSTPPVYVYVPFYDSQHPQYTREGYNLLGYRMDNVQTNPLIGVDESGTFVFSSSGTSTSRYYCQWQRKTYIISFDANGGTNAPAAQTKTHGTDLTLSNETPTRTGHVFLGWNTSQDGTGTAYAPGATFAVDAATTLYATWELLTYTISFDANGGENAPAAQTKTYGADLTLTDSEPTRTGYTFAGWALSNEAAEADYQPGDTYAGNGNATLYAVWAVVVSTHTLTYDANGGTNAPAAQTQTYSVEDQRSFTVTGDQPTREGHAFLGWSNTSGGTVDYEAGDTITAAVDKTIYAVWEKVRFTVSYNANGGSNAPAAQTKQKGVALTITDGVPSKQSSVFMGWATSAAATEAEYHGGDSFTTDADTVLYAVWGTHSIMSVFVIQDGEPVECDAYVVVSGEPVLCDVYVGGE